MAVDGLPVDKLRQYLRDLKPEARALLLTELERKRARGETLQPSAQFVLEALRQSLRKPDPAAAPEKATPKAEAPQAAKAERKPAAKPAPAAANPVTAPARGSVLPAPARIFFQPFEVFFVDDGPERVHPGRISRALAQPLWEWIGNDLAPAETKAFVDAATRAMAVQDTATSERAAKQLQDLVAQRIRQLLSGNDQDDRLRRRLGGQLTSPRPIDDLRTIADILRAREALAVLANRLPAHIRTLADDQLEQIKMLLDSLLAKHQPVFLPALLLVMSRLAAPWQLIRLATRAAESDVASRVAESPYGVAVTIVLAEMERLVGRLREVIKTNRTAGIGDLLKQIHDSARALRTEMDLSTDSPWARRLAAMRAEISDLLRAGIEPLPGQLRRLLRPRPAKEIAPTTRLDPTDVEEAEAALEFVSICRTYASELAINEVTLRVYSEVQNYLDTGTTALLDGLRTAGDADRPFRMSQVEAAVRFSGRIFGPNYASLLAKAAEVAVQGERKAAAKA